MEIIRCSKCKKEIPKQYKKKYKILWWSFEYSKYETDYYEYYDMSKGFGIHLCLDCMRLFNKWLSITPTQAQTKSESLNKGKTK